jgi:hypothetical protein
MGLPAESSTLSVADLDEAIFAAAAGKDSRAGIEGGDRGDTGSDRIHATAAFKEDGFFTAVGPRTVVRIQSRFSILTPSTAST